MAPSLKRRLLPRTRFELQCRQIRLVAPSRLMAPLILLRRLLLGSLPPVTRLPQRRRRAGGLVPNTFGKIGPTVEQFHTPLLLAPTKRTRPPLRLSIFLQCQREPGAQLPRLADGRTMYRLCGCRPSQPLGTVSLVGVAQERDLFLERAIQSQSQWADLSRRAPALPIIDRVTERFIQSRSSRTVADKLSAAGWSWGYCSAVTPNGWRWIVNAHRGDGRRYI